MRILHIVPGMDFSGNGIAVAARLIVQKQRNQGNEVELMDAAAFSASRLKCGNFEEVWVHSLWTWRVWKACLGVLLAGGKPKLVRMTHANLDPLRYRYHGWKKRLVAPIERWLFARTDRVVVTGEWEAEWCRQWGLKNVLETIDLKPCFKLPAAPAAEPHRQDHPLRVLYLGRRHPLKGIAYLERAVSAINAAAQAKGSATLPIELKIVSDATDDEKERAWQWSEVLCLPTLSENFGLVVAEALERGKPVITTDGAPAWAPVSGRPECVIYLRGFREGSEAERVQLLEAALKRVIK